MCRPPRTWTNTSSPTCCCDWKTTNLKTKYTSTWRGRTSQRHRTSRLEGRAADRTRSLWTSWTSWIGRSLWRRRPMMRTCSYTPVVDCSCVEYRYSVKQCCGSGMFIPDPGSGSAFSSKNLNILTQKIVSMLADTVYDPGCSSWIRIPDPDLNFLPIPDPGSWGQRDCLSLVKMVEAVRYRLLCH